MKKSLIIIFVALVVLVAGFFTLNAYIYQEKQGDSVEESEVINQEQPIGKRTPPTDAKNAIYIIDGKPVELFDGVSEVESAPGSASKVVTRYFGNEVTADLDKDGREDVVFLLTQSTGGSGTFFYVVAALNTEGGYIGSEALLLGDRIAPQTTEKRPNNVIVVNYADRKKGESFAMSPSVGKSIWLKLDPKTMQWGEVAQNFEGEADPSRMTLGMKTWNWMHMVNSDATEVAPRGEKQFTLTFDDSGRFSAKTDCNSASGAYMVNGTSISFTKIASTKMYCEGSQEGEFIKMLGDVTSFHFTSKGELIFDLGQGGVTVFR